MKKYSIIFIALGFVLITFGAIYFSFKDSSSKPIENENLEDNNDNEDVTPPKDNLVVNTSLIAGDEINNTLYDYYKVNNLVTDEIKSKDLSIKNKYVFAYSNDFSNVIAENNSVRAKGLKSSFSALMLPASFSFDNEYFIDSYKRLGFDLFKSYVSNDDIKISNYSVKYMKVIAKKSNNNNLDNYRENFVILIEESDNYKFAIRYEIIDSRFTDDILTSFLKQIKIEKKSAKYLYTSLNDGKIVGSLKKNAELDVSSFYEVSYKLDSNKYVEIENGNNTINYNTISLKSNPDMNIFLKTVVYSTNVEVDFLDDSMGYMYETFTTDLKVINSSVSIVSIKEKSFLKSFVSFTTSDNKSMYLTAIAYKISDNIYYVASVVSDSVIADSLLDDFADITYKKVLN